MTLKGRIESRSGETSTPCWSTRATHFWIHKYSILCVIEGGKRKKGRQIFRYSTFIFQRFFKVIILKGIKFIFCSRHHNKTEQFESFINYVNCSSCFREWNKSATIHRNKRGETTWNNSDTCTYQQMYILQYRTGMFWSVEILGHSIWVVGAVEKKDNQRVKLLQSAGFLRKKSRSGSTICGDPGAGSESVRDLFLSLFTSLHSYVCPVKSTWVSCIPLFSVCTHQ